MMVSALLLMSVLPVMAKESPAIGHEDRVDAVCRLSPHISEADYAGMTEMPADLVKQGRTVAFKTNAVPWIMAIMNMEVELQVSHDFTVTLPVWWSPYFIGRRHALRTLALQPEGRYWLKSVGKGHFFGLHLGVAWFNLLNGATRYQDNGRPLINGGVSYGYALCIDDRWGVEFTAGVGYATMRYDRFYNISNGALIDTRKTSYWGLDHVGVSLVYRFDI